MCHNNSYVFKLEVINEARELMDPLRLDSDFQRFPNLIYFVEHLFAAHERNVDLL